MSLNRNDIKTEIYRLLELGTITDDQANQIFDKSYENQQNNSDIMLNINDTAAEWVQQKITTLVE
jgi:hypothetical protein